jgi:hypothetical protein
VAGFVKVTFDSGERELHQVDRAGGGGFTAALDEKPVQHMLAVLGLDDGILGRMAVAAGRLIPLAVATAHMPALHLNNRNADARPDQVSLVLGGFPDHRHGVQQHRIVGKLFAQDLPDPPLGRPAQSPIRTPWRARTSGSRSCLPDLHG